MPTLNPQSIALLAGRTGPISGALFVDDFGIGTLTIGNGGMVNVGISVGVAVFPGSTRTVNTSAASGQPASAGSTGTLVIGAASGQVAVAPGTLTTPSVAFGDGTGRIVFNHTASNYTFAPTLSGPGLVEVDAGSKIQTANNTDTRATTISGGALIVNRSIASSAPLR